jgi:hypothetical protein
LIGYHNHTETAQTLHHNAIASSGLPSAATATASPSSATTSPLSLTKPQQKVLLFAMKKNLCHAMFANDAMPRQKDEHNNIIRAAINAASDTVLGMHPPPIKLRSRGVDHMWETSSAFRKYAENTVDIHFGLQQPLRGTTDADEVSHRRQSATILLAMENYRFLHMIVDVSKIPYCSINSFYLILQGTTLYFEHACIRSAISRVVWKTLKCSDVLQPENMAPLVALVATSFIIALEVRAATTENPSSEQFLEIYRQVFDFISHIVYTDPVAQNNFIEFCTLVISCSYSVLGPGVAETPDENDF